MRNLYTPKRIRVRKLGFLLTCLAGALPYTGYSQLTYTFTNAGATGTMGPTQAQVNTAYASTNLNGLVTVTNGIQSFTVPNNAPYRIVAIGAHGGYNGGYGAYASGDYTFTAGTVLKILVGQAGSQATGATYIGGGGGGGSFVSDPSNVPYVVGGGGGGNGDGYTGATGASTLLAMSGNTATPGNTGGNTLSNNGGSGGTGGTCGVGTGGGGGGYTGAGSVCSAMTAASSYTNGGGGGLGYPAGNSGDGGFGGGAGGYFSGVGNRGGGGGGYSGGGGGDTPNFSEGAAYGGGGGSFSSGTNPTFSISTLTGAGQVMLILLCDVNLTSSGTPSLAPIICSGQSLTLTTNATAGTFTWSNGNTTSNTIVVTPTAALSTYSVVGASPSLGCSNAAGISVTVSPAAPVLTVSSSSTTPCFGNTITLNATGALTYTWTNPGVVNGGTVAPPNGTTVYTVSGTNGCGTSTAAITITASPLPITIAASSQLVCSATPVTLTATGATNYTWTPGLNMSNPFITNPASNTTYSVLGMTGPCSGNATITINTKPNPSMNISASNTVVCDGGSSNLTVSGNATTYTWNPGGQNGTNVTVTPTTTTLFSVTGTNSVNCVSTVQQVVIVMPNPTVNVTVSDAVVCSGGASTLSANGAGTYVWTNGSNASTTVVNPTANSTYTVTGTATNNCVGTATAAVSVFQPSISVSSATSVCSGSVAMISASGADTYIWSNGATSAGITVTPTLTTVYTVTGSVTDPNSNISCDADGSVQVSINPSPVVTASADHSVICLGNSAMLTGDGANTYTWTGGAGTIASATILVNPIANQTFSVAGTDANGCVGRSSIQIQVSACTGIATIAASNTGMMVYPNPSNGEFTISSEQDITLYLSNELGQQVKVITLSGNNHEVKVSGLSNGVYFITGTNATGSVKEKIIIAK